MSLPRIKSGVKTFVVDYPDDRSGYTREEQTVLRAGPCSAPALAHVFGLDDIQKGDEVEITVRIVSRVVTRREPVT